MAKAKDGERYNSLYLNLKANDPTHEQIYEFLLSAGNKRSELLVHAVEEFIEKYNLSGASKKKIHLFLSEYEPDGENIVPISNSVQNKSVETVKVSEPDSLNEDMLDNSMLELARNQLKMFG